MDFALTQLNPGVRLFGVLVATLGLSYAANYWLSRIFRGKTYRYLIAPGVIVHEYSHAVGCVLTGARIREIRVFERTGGRVVHEESRLPFGEGLISMAPIFGAALAAYLLARLLVPGFVGLADVEFSSWRFLLFTYLAASITAAMAPSGQDLKVGLAGFSFGCLVLGVGASIEPVDAYFSALFGGALERLFAVVLFGLILLAVLTAAAGLAYLVLHRTTRRGTTYHSAK